MDQASRVGKPDKEYAECESFSMPPRPDTAKDHEQCWARNSFWLRSHLRKSLIAHQGPLSFRPNAKRPRLPRLSAGPLSESNERLSSRQHSLKGLRTPSRYWWCGRNRPFAFGRNKSSRSRYCCRRLDNAPLPSKATRACHGETKIGSEKPLQDKSTRVFHDRPKENVYPKNIRTNLLFSKMGYSNRQPQNLARLN